MKQLNIGKGRTAFALAYKSGQEETAIRYVDFVAMSRFSRHLITENEKLSMMKEAREKTGVDLAFLQPDPEMDWMNIEVGTLADQKFQKEGIFHGES